MARRRGGRTPGRETGGPVDPSVYYVKSESDVKYVKAARQRLFRQRLRAWVIRLAILAVIAFAARTWGPDVLRAVRVQSHMTTEEFEGVGDHIKAGRDRRSGADFVEE